MSVLKLIGLAMKRFESDDAYREMQAHIALETLSDLTRLGVDVGSSDMLEFPAGRGGYARVFRNHCKSLTAADIHRSEVFDGDLADLEFVAVDALEPFPLPGAAFDLVHCASLIEHLPELDNLLSEIRRVLRPGGHLLLSFPPFWSIFMVGGHQFKPFHFLGERIAVGIASRRLSVKISGYSDNYSGEGGLYVRTIGQVRNALSAAGFDVLDVYPRSSRFNTAAFPGRLADLFTWHACFLVLKPSS